jgi:hypothetical protein
MARSLILGQSKIMTCGDYSTNMARQIVPYADLAQGVLSGATKFDVALRRLVLTLAAGGRTARPGGRGRGVHFSDFIRSWWCCPDRRPTQTRSSPRGGDPKPPPGASERGVLLPGRARILPGFLPRSLDTTR